VQRTVSGKANTVLRNKETESRCF